MKFNKNENYLQKRTKIITTIGPATDSIAQIRELFCNGMNTIRLNFSHGNHQEQGQRIDWAKQLMQEINKPISVMLDTKGPEIRIGKMNNNEQKIWQGSEVTVYTTEHEFINKNCFANEITVSYDMSKDLKKGDKILVDDGKLQLIVTNVQPGTIKTFAFNNHVLKSNKRVNLPGVEFSLPFLSEKDKADIKFGIEKKIDYIAASFVSSQDDIKQIRILLKEFNSEDIQIIAKIESQIAINKIDEIIAASDGVMVARGDLGLEIPYYEVPYWEKVIIRKCRKAGKVVIVATQMLESMTDNPSPTRAEVTDVYFATELGADATMLSGESANGSFPILATKVMATINSRAESEFYEKLYYEKQLIEALESLTPERATIAKEIAIKCKNGQFPYVIVLSNTGELLKAVSKVRPNTSIIGISNNNTLFTKFGCCHSVFMSRVENYKAFIEAHEESISEIAKTWGAEKEMKILFVHQQSIKEFIIK